MTGRQLEEFYFIGVTTAGSTIGRLFPRWAELLGIHARLVGRDLPLGAAPRRFRAVVAEIAERPWVRGGLVTTHKLAVYRHAADLFGTLDGHARACGEVSCIVRRDGQLAGYAKDPITAGRALDEMLGRDYFGRLPAHVLCLGAGGAGVAITRLLVSLRRPPARVVLTDVDEGRLAAAARVHGDGSSVEYRKVRGPGDTDPLVAALPPGSLVINATGMGKDRPGSPVGDGVTFPERGVIWDLNYRGELAFLALARAQRSERRLAVHDGWRYFLHGWAEHLAEVFGFELTPDRFATLARAGEPFRPDGP